jgi:uncharacterized protein YjiS (DUF1127 family)
MVVVVAERAIEMRDGKEFNLAAAVSRMLSNMRTYAHRRRVQKRLEGLDDRMLEDIGIMRADIKAHVWGR